MQTSTSKSKRLTCGLLIIAALIFIWANSLWAYPLTNPTVSWNTSHWATFTVNGSSASWYTEYFLYADEFTQFDSDGKLDAFCVENADVVAKMSYELIPVPAQDSKLQQAAIIADLFFNGNSDGWSKSAAQIAIWEIMFDDGLDLHNGDFQYWGTNAYFASAQDILNKLSALSATGGIVSLAHSPIGSSGVQASQDYLVAAPVPEPSAMLFMGAGLIGLAGLGRKKLFKKC